MSKNSKRQGRSIELFFVNGDPDGMVTATVPFQWTGHVLVIPRTQISEALAREEATRPGTYLLVGEVNGSSHLYVGETDLVKDRLKTHVREKDWWETAISITSSGEPLNKAHVRYLESKLFERAQHVRKIAVDYGRSPTISQLSEPGRAHMDDFLDNLFLVLKALGFDFFNEDTLDKKKKTKDSSSRIPKFKCTIKKENITATARLEDGRFIVEEGSDARKDWVGTGSESSTYGKLHAELVAQGILIENGKHRKFIKDYAFKSTSAAAAVVSGRAASGPISWTTLQGNKSYSEWESEQL